MSASGLGEASVASLFDETARGYALTRRADPRIARAIRAGLGDVASVVNVGAGTGSYEPSGLGVAAIEPSREMIRQRPAGASPAVQAVAERLPLKDASIDAALAILTIHHWSDWRAGVAELARVARRRIVILTWDPASQDAFWLTTEYLPAVIDLDLRRFPVLAELARCLRRVEIAPVPVPHDCRDGFLGAFWRRPEAYLDPAVRRGISSFALMDPAMVRAGLARLGDDLRSGRWDARFGRLRTEETADLGYRLLVAELTRG